LETGRENILVEIANEIDIPLFHHDILTPARVHELVKTAQGVSRDGRRLLVSVSMTWFPFAKAAGVVVPERIAGFEALAAAIVAPVGDILRSIDFVLFHTNILESADEELIIRAIKRRPELAENPRPLFINEDGTAVANLDMAARHGVGWGYYDQGEKNDYVEGFQSPPVNWGLSTAEKRAFFGRVKEITGA
jgi:hypothetical protein